MCCTLKKRLFSILFSSMLLHELFIRRIQYFHQFIYRSQVCAKFKLTRNSANTHDPNFIQIIQLLPTSHGEALSVYAIIIRFVINCYQFVLKRNNTRKTTKLQQIFSRICVTINHSQNFVWIELSWKKRFDCAYTDKHAIPKNNLLNGISIVHSTYTHCILLCAILWRRWLCICALIMYCCNSIARLINATQIQCMCALNWDNVFTWLINHKINASNINRFEAVATRSHAHTLNGLQTIAHARYYTPYDSVFRSKKAQD